MLLQCKTCCGMTYPQLWLLGLSEGNAHRAIPEDHPDNGTCKVAANFWDNAISVDTNGSTCALDIDQLL